MYTQWHLAQNIGKNTFEKEKERHIGQPKNKISLDPKKRRTKRKKSPSQKERGNKE